MKLESISIDRGASYGPHAGKFVAKAKVKGESMYGETDINVTIDPEQLEPITAILAQIVARNMAAAAESFRAEVAGSLAPTVEHAAIEAPAPASFDDGTIPF